MSNPESPMMPLVFMGAAAGAAALLASGVSGLWNFLEMPGLRDAQAEEQSKYSALFSITAPLNQPAGTVLAAWDLPGYDDIHHYRARKGADGTISLSDTYTPSPALVRKSTVVSPCDRIQLPTTEVYRTEHFSAEGKVYQVAFTKLGNAAVCQK